LTQLPQVLCQLLCVVFRRIRPLAISNGFLLPLLSTVKQVIRINPLGAQIFSQFIGALSFYFSALSFRFGSLLLSHKLLAHLLHHRFG
jgi:hypothetical protein